MTTRTRNLLTFVANVSLLFFAWLFITAAIAKGDTCTNPVIHTTTTYQLHYTHPYELPTLMSTLDANQETVVSITVQETVTDDGGCVPPPPPVYGCHDDGSGHVICIDPPLCKTLNGVCPMPPPCPPLRQVTDWLLVLTCKVVTTTSCVL